MRFDTHRVSAFLVEEIQKQRPHLEVTDHGGDILHVRTGTGEMIYIYLIESPITVYEIRGIVEPNTANGIYSLFILWGELFVPIHGARYRPDKSDWMAAFLALGQDRLYAFDPYAEDLFIFPVFFDGPPGDPDRLIRYGRSFDVGRLTGRLIETRSPLIAGCWRMADFEPTGDRTRPAVPLRRDDLSAAYALLGLIPHEPLTRDMVKGAYRRLARQHHPDVNDHPDATAHMQRLNHAYLRVLKDLSARPPAP